MLSDRVGTLLAGTHELEWLHCHSSEATMYACSDAWASLQTTACGSNAR